MLGKKLRESNTYNVDFAMDILGDSPIAGIKIDNVLYHPTLGWLLFIFIRCTPHQTVTPFSSHPNKYWKQNKNRFLTLWRAKQDMPATLYLVNYANKEDEHGDKVALLKVTNVSKDSRLESECTKMTRAEFRAFFVRLQRESLGATK